MTGESWHLTFIFQQLNVISYALDGHPYMIYFFLGQVADSDLTSQNISEHSRLVGSVYTFLGLHLLQ